MPFINQYPTSRDAQQGIFGTYFLAGLLGRGYHPAIVSAKLACPRCSTVGRVHVEHVIRSGKSYNSYECKGCSHVWQVHETESHAPTIDDERPDRSRASFTSKAPLKP